MDAIEKRARELLANQIETVPGYALAAQEMRDGVELHGYSMLQSSISAIIAALTPPEGWVLMPRVLTEEMLQAGYPAETAQEGYEAMIAARPAVQS